MRFHVKNGESSPKNEIESHKTTENMRKITGNDSIFDKLIYENDSYVYNLLYLIREVAGSFLVTDDKSYIMAQSDPHSTLWIFLADIHEEKTKYEIKEIIKERFSYEHYLKINAKEHSLLDVIRDICVENNITYRKELDLNVYACEKTKDVRISGDMEYISESTRKEAGILVTAFEYELRNKRISTADCERFIDLSIENRGVYLWRDGGVVAMASVEHKTDKFARIGKVMTDMHYRGKGYAKMLIKKMSDELLSQEITPVLYADKNNPASNSVYKNVGYLPRGIISEFTLTA